MYYSVVLYTVCMRENPKMFTRSNMSYYEPLIKISSVLKTT